MYGSNSVNTESKCYFSMKLQKDFPVSDIIEKPCPV